MPGIVVGVDESAHARRALDWAMREAGLRQVALTVITVIPAMASPFTAHPLAVPDADEVVAHARTAVEEAVAKSAGDLAGPNPASVSVNVFVGFPVQSLIEASHDAELVVVGSRGTGGFATLMLGSVTTQVAHHAACPVVIMHTGR
jgi:nucleotide-binding universal stress UspA family protein